jgi:hypothetical protein
MSEYEMIAFRDDKAEPVESQWFGSRPSDEWITKLAESAGLGNYLGPGTNVANYGNGYIEIRKHSKSTNHPPAKKRR